jgi:hypothetical protein
MEFRESLAPVMPSAMPLPEVRPLPRPLLRTAAYTLWVLAAIAAGAGLGAYIISQHPAATTTVSPLPIATAKVAVTPVASATLVTATTKVAAVTPVAPADSVYQSQLGDIWQVSTANAIQASAQPEALQPGFTAYGYGQGGPGTDPVVKK